ncbi:MAG: hypothetical protein WD734_05370 [Dehalococcoidia bacterium]
MGGLDDLLTPEGWFRRVAAEQAAGHLIISAEVCPACQGALPLGEPTPEGRLVPTRGWGDHPEYAIRPCRCGIAVLRQDLLRAHGLDHEVDSGDGQGARLDE